MSKDALVSIIVPVYNMGAKIEACVGTLLKQTYRNLEIILIDDGSKDNSYRILKKIENLDKRVKAYHTENCGSGPARNYGISHCHGKYMFFPDADDLLNEDAIAILVNAIEESDTDLIVFGFQSINNSRNIISKKIFHRKIIDGKVARTRYANYLSMERPYTIQGAPWNKFFKHDLIIKYRIEYPPLRRHQDEAFIARYVTHVKNIYFINDILYSYYVNDLKLEWDKYPTTYIDSVIGLYEDRKLNMLKWCESDVETHDMVIANFISGVIKALELSFSPKFNFDVKERMIWIEDTIKKSNIICMRRPNSIGKYQRLTMTLIKQKLYRCLYMLLCLKVLIERNGMLRIVKRFF